MYQWEPDQQAKIDALVAVIRQLAAEEHKSHYRSLRYLIEWTERQGPMDSFKFVVDSTLSRAFDIVPSHRVKAAAALIFDDADFYGG
jgi:hypothetical protein